MPKCTIAKNISIGQKNKTIKEKLARKVEKSPSTGLELKIFMCHTEA